MIILFTYYNDATYAHSMVNLGFSLAYRSHYSHELAACWSVLRPHPLHHLHCHSPSASLQWIMPSLPATTLLLMSLSLMCTLCHGSFHYTLPWVLPSTHVSTISSLFHHCHPQAKRGSTLRPLSLRPYVIWGGDHLS